MSEKERKSAGPEPPAEEEGFYAEVNSGLEPILVERIFSPLLRLVPEHVAPNTITFIGALIAWMAFALAYLSTWLSAGMKGLALAGAGLCIFGSMTADSLDGMQARRTGRTSKLGEFLDHWLDSIHVPMTPAGLCIALSLEPWQAALVMMTLTPIYNGQLVLYHRTGRFVHPRTSGVDGQFYVSLLYFALGLFVPFFNLPPWLKAALCIVAAAIQLGANIFYLRRLGRYTVAHAPFLLFCAVATTLYLLGVMNAATYCLLMVVISWRVTGSWVLRTLTKRDYNGWDSSVVLWLGLVAAAHFIPAVGRMLGAAGPHLALIACGVLAAHNLTDVARYWRQLI